MKRIRNYKILIIFVICVLIYLAVLLCICTSVKRMDSGNEDVFSLMQIADAINDRDRNALKIMFSDKALNESPTIDEDIEALFNIFQEEIVKWDVTMESSSTESIMDSVKPVSYVDKTFFIRAGMQNYHIAYCGYLFNKENPDEEGLYSIYIIKPSDEDIYNESSDIIWPYQAGDLPGIIIENFEDYNARV